MIPAAENKRELHRVLQRMEERGFPPNDELQGLTRETYHKLQQLRMHAHYLGCSGVGQ
jgi:DNA polymerase I-like protein with 3'-5' exonuclease and polymerase domains